MEIGDRIEVRDIAHELRRLVDEAQQQLVLLPSTIRVVQRLDGGGLDRHCERLAAEIGRLDVFARKKFTSIHCSCLSDGTREKNRCWWCAEHPHRAPQEIDGPFGQPLSARTTFRTTQLVS